ncbi:TerC family protein [Pseudomonas sp. MDMC216]|jgi:tellurite resistance protein TerC|uniref:Tellurite resistance protein TerC n=1 Tax=Pseudomonas sihuiensis TaxID=1274359 RepID=A0A1H2M4F0_9PSED|nr:MULTISPECIES: TerC family protein [Pseudomonas]ERH51607.1 membrane protein [Pseudomonas chengduensis]MBG0848142.1 TerC family protein [Pseudomonas chengduensis]MDH1622179.1 TerC family protein [Pseudomonas chengduensis]MDH1869675.1 TerC family protein [Pseudomonas chengduensis]MDI5992677.1 TerC family protein [Pseudomonas sp. MDMC216]
MTALEPFLFADFLGTATWLWLVFIAVVISLLAFDLGVLHRDNREIGVRESLLLSGGYITAGLLFGVWVFFQKGGDASMDYLTGFLIEKSLSMDNVFLMAMIFSFLAIPRQYQHKVLFWGIMGVLVLRAIMIGLGAALIHEFAWILYVFGAFLFFTGVKMLFSKLDDAPDLQNNVLVKFLRKHLRVTDNLHGQRFFVRQDDGQGRSVLWVTPLFLALIMIECADLVFAIDSVPAIFAITQDPFIVYTSNIFAILGLRALYFALAALIHRFAYLKYALALVLVFIGAKIFLVGIIGKIPAVVSLSVTLGLLIGGVLLSLYKTRGQPPAQI